MAGSRRTPFDRIETGMGDDVPVGDLIRELFKVCPDYSFCRTLAENVREGITTHAAALGHAAQRARADETLRHEIEERLNRRSVHSKGKVVPLKDLSLREILDQDDAVLTDIVRFYFKHPFAHGRTRRSRWLPAWLRTFFLRALLGNAHRRQLDLDYSECFEMLTLL